MKRFLLVGVLAVLAVFAVVGLAAAQDATPPAPEQGPMMGGRGMMGAGQGYLHAYMQEEMAKALGLTVEELQERHANGETFWQIAEAQGYTEEEAQQLMVDARNAALDAAVADGVISQEQADWMKQHGARMGGRGMGPGGCSGMGGGSQGGGMMGRGRWNRDS